MFCSSCFSCVLSNTGSDLLAHETLGQKRGKDHMWLKVNVVFIFILNVSLFVFHSGGGNDEAVFPVSGSFLF